METIQIKRIEESILLISLNRPEVRNAINAQMMQELAELWGNLASEHQNQKLRCIVLTGAGNRAFCAGADLKERLNLSLDTWRSQHLALQKAILSLTACPIPVIAAVNGAAFGGGLELALACDFIYASDKATFAQSEVKLGIMPGAMGTQNLPKACGIRQAKELTYTGDAFDAEQAFEWGIVNKLFKSEQLLEETLITARQISDNAPLAIRQIKKAINASLTLEIQAGYEFELEAYNTLLDTRDREEGIEAFNEKRRPVFTNE